MKGKVKLLHEETHPSYKHYQGCPCAECKNNAFDPRNRFDVDRLRNGYLDELGETAEHRRLLGPSLSMKNMPPSEIEAINQHLTETIHKKKHDEMNDYWKQHWK